MKQETKSVERTPKAPRRGDKEEKERRRKRKEKAETKETAEKVREDAAPQNAKGSKKKKNRGKKRGGRMHKRLARLAEDPYRAIHQTLPDKYLGERPPLIKRGGPHRD